MAIKYTKQQVLDKLEQARFEMGIFYQQDFVNYSGETIDTNEQYTEVIAEWLIGNFSLLGQIPPITRTSSYKMQTHKGWTTSPASNRLEERIAMAMFRQRGLPWLGLVMDYQTPLKDKQTSRAGKIDLMTYDGAVLRIMELKEPESKETMLRCVLEGYTYLKTANTGKLLQEFQLPPGTKVQACPLVYHGKFQHLEMKAHRPYLKHLMELLDCETFYYEMAEEYYIVTK